MPVLAQLFDTPDADAAAAGFHLAMADALSDALIDAAQARGTRIAWSTLGNPLADLAYHLMAWRLAPDEFRGLKGHDLAALGLPDEAAHLASYVAHGGRPPGATMDYLMAFNMFRMAAILQGILARAQQGNAAAADARLCHVVTIGTPHHGTWLARFGHTPNARQMRPGSNWLVALARPAPARGVGGRPHDLHAGEEVLIFDHASSPGLT